MMDRFNKRRPLSQSPAFSTRAAERDSLFLLTAMSTVQGHGLARVRVRNLSAMGLMADCPVAVARGEEVTVDLRGIGPVNGTIVWVQGERIGMAFSQPIDPRSARVPLRRSSHAMPDYLRPVRKIR